jgi:hypothetical protein
MATSTPIQQENGGTQVTEKQPRGTSTAARAAQVAIRELREEQAGLDYERIQRVKARRREATG